MNKENERCKQQRLIKSCFAYFAICDIWTSRVKWMGIKELITNHGDDN